MRSYHYETIALKPADTAQYLMSENYGRDKIQASEVDNAELLRILYDMELLFKISEHKHFPFTLIADDIAISLTIAKRQLQIQDTAEGFGENYKKMNKSQLFANLHTDLVDHYGSLSSEDESDQEEMESTENGCRKMIKKCFGLT